MEREELQIISQPPQVANYNNDNLNNNINIKHYGLHLRTNIKRLYTKRQAEVNQTPKGLNIINMGIHNLTQYTFTGNELYLLSLGLKFKLPFHHVCKDHDILNCFDIYCNKLKNIKKAKITNAHDNKLGLCNKLTSLITKWHKNSIHKVNTSDLVGIHGIPLKHYIKKCRYKLKKTLI